MSGVGPPALGAFSLGRIFPNPLAGRALSASVSLPDAAPAQLSLFDLRGRRLARRLVEAGASGTEVVQLRIPGGLRSGVYMLQLEQRGRVMSRKVSIVH